MAKAPLTPRHKRSPINHATNCCEKVAFACEHSAPTLYRAVET